MIKISNDLGTATHTSEVEECRIQTDSIKVSIPISVLSDDAQKLLTYWWVEDFDYAYINWQDGEIRLGYRTAHYLPAEYDDEELDEDDELYFCDLGELTISPGVQQSVKQEEVQEFLARHKKRDNGDLDYVDVNLFAPENWFRTFSAYHDSNGVCVWVVTESDRGITMVILPDEYKREVKDE